MTSSRSLANQKLYHARILAASWRTALAAEAIPATILAQAFDESTRDHLRQAYGWFLLEIVVPAALPETPPERTTALPEPAPGKVFPGEIRELQRLEQHGWLAEMLKSEPQTRPQGKAAGNLAIVTATVSGPDQVDQWIEQLQEIFNRMADSLDEY